MYKVSSVDIGGRNYKKYLEKREKILLLHNQGKLGSRYYKLVNGKKTLKSAKELIKELEF